MLRATLLALVLATPLALALPGDDYESPADGRCDATSLLVCALAGAGATATCAAPTATGHVEVCTFAYGWGWEGFSRAGIPGDADGTGKADLLFCRGMGGCTLAVIDTYTAPPFACSWAGPIACGANDDGGGSLGPFTLALGECVKVGVHATATTNGRAGAAGATLATATYTEPTDGAGAACHDDNGRT